MKGTLFVTDIPAPYRVDLYNEMHMRVEDFQVWYFLREIPTRPWKFNSFLLTHKYWISNGLYLRIRSYNLFFNPRLILRLLRNQPKDLILALGWNDFDVLIICILKRLGLIKSNVGFWSEANFLSIGAKRQNFLKHQYRKFIYNTADGFQLMSGKITQKTFSIWGVDVKKEIFFPNTISEEVHDPEKIRILRDNKVPTILICARLIEKYKGINNFFCALTNEQIESCRFLIAGEGPDRRTLEALIDRRKLFKHIELLGNLNSSSLAKYYSNVDAFCLPSFSDQNPLSVIEALRWKLPLLISNHCGNVEEAIMEGKNGYSFSPYAAQNISQTFEKFMKVRDSWPQMGEESAKIFSKIYQRDNIIANFVRELR